MNQPPQRPAATPSDAYQRLMAAYADMHLNGDPANAIPSDKIFDGRGLVPHLEVVRQLCGRFRPRSLLDYGCGKAKPYAGTRATHPDGSEDHGLQALWGLEEVAFFDPALQQYAELPQRSFDAVVATHVLEFTPEADVDWVLAELFAFARKFVFLSIACHASPWTLGNGENYHATQQSPGWWTDRLWAARAWTPETRCFALLYPTERKPILVEI